MVLFLSYVITIILCGIGIFLMMFDNYKNGIDTTLKDVTLYSFLIICPGLNLVGILVVLYYILTNFDNIVIINGRR